MEVGDKLGSRYLLEGKFGKGHFGQVWRAWDTELKRRVAIKVLHELDSDMAAREKLKKEASLAGQLQDPGVTMVFDFGEHQGRPFIVMEFLEGRNLAQLLLKHSKGLPVARVLDLAIKMASALQATHAHGIMHRDLKPGNIMILADDQLKICDFGIARAEGDMPTAPGILKLTPEYASPEQFKGTSSKRSDLYSLGCVIYAMLSGGSPFGSWLDRVDYAHLHNEKVPDPPRGIEEIPQELLDLVRKLLAKEPADRPQDAASVAWELRRMQASLDQDPDSSVNRWQAKKDAQRLSASDAATVRRELEEMGTAQAEQTLQYVSLNPVPEAIAGGLDQLSAATAAAVLALPDIGWSARFVEAMNASKAADVLAEFKSAAAGGILASLSPKRAAEILSADKRGLAPSWVAKVEVEQARLILREMPKLPYLSLMAALAEYPAAQKLVDDHQARMQRVRPWVLSARVTPVLLALLTIIMEIASPAQMTLALVLWGGIPTTLLAITGTVLASRETYLDVAPPRSGTLFSLAAVITLIPLWATEGIGNAALFAFPLVGFAAAGAWSLWEEHSEWVARWAAS